MALVESNYLEEQRKLRNIERSHRDREDQRRKVTEQAHLIVSNDTEGVVSSILTCSLAPSPV